MIILKSLQRDPLAKSLYIKAFNRHSVCFYSNLVPTIKDLFLNPPNVNSSISTQGHIKSIRQFKKVGFIDLSDGSIYKNLSIVLQEPEKVLSELQLKVGQSVSVKGTWIESKGNQSFELVYNPSEAEHKFKVIGDVVELYPIQKKNQTYQFLRSLPVLRHRTSTLASILRLRSFVESRVMEFFNKNGFIKVSPPIITSSDCEGGGEQFKVESMHKPSIVDGKTKEHQFFGKPAYLTVSSQLHLEVLCQSLNRVWTLSPCFRAEDSNTNRHLSEFWMLEAEIAYVEDVAQLTKFSEQMIRSVVSDLQSTKDLVGAGNSTDVLGSRFNKQEIDKMQQRWDSLLTDKEWPTITYTEALKILNSSMKKTSLKWGDSIQTEHEKWLAGTYFSSPVFITDYPMSQKPFYMPKSKNFNPDFPTVACYDLIVPEIGELIGGSVREHRYDALIDAMKLRNMNIDEMEWYLSTRLNGSIPHGGFGMGYERLICYLGAMDNLKDIIPFPRVPDSCAC